MYMEKATRAHDKSVEKDHRRGTGAGNPASGIMNIFRLHFLLFLARVLCTTNSSSAQTLVARTADDALHILRGHTDGSSNSTTFRLDLLNTAEKNNVEPLEKRLAARHAHAIEDEAPGTLKALPPRLAEASLSQDGFLEIGGMRIPVSRLLLRPFHHDGLFAIASKTHSTRLLFSDILVVTAHISVDLFDTSAHARRTLGFSYVVHFNSRAVEYKFSGNSLHLSSSVYNFSAPVVALYECCQFGQLRLMVRLFPTEAAIQQAPLPGLSEPEEQKNQARWMVVLLSLLTTLYLALLYRRRRVVATRRIVSCGSLGLWSGKYMGRLCLIYCMDKSMAASCALRSAPQDCDQKRGGGDGAAKMKNSWEPAGEDHSPGRHQRHTQAHTESTEVGEESRTGEYEGVEIIFAGRLPSFCFRHVVCTEMTWQLEPVSPHAAPDTLHTLFRFVARLHSRARVHGRLCPENVRVNSQGLLKVQHIFDSSGWCSGRQILGAFLLPQDDWFALGCVAHYLLTGTHPFDRAGPEKPARRAAVRSYTIYDGSSVSTAKSTAGSVAYDSGCVLGSKKGDNATASRSRRSEGHGRTVYRQLISSERLQDIERQILRGSHIIRLADQIEHDLIYSALFKSGPWLVHHPYFWPVMRRTELLCDFSDFIESQPALKHRIERLARVVFDRTWDSYLHPLIRANIAGKRRYDCTRLCDLLRFIRNTQRHLLELPYADLFLQDDGQVGGYYMHVFPELFMLVYRSREIRASRHFQRYFEAH